VFDAEALAQQFAAHVFGCPSGIVACSVRAAVESWFQVELAHMMFKSGRFDSVQFGYDYPAGGKADLAAESDEGLFVFELKCFVQGADARKNETWPSQLGRLAQLVDRGVAWQGVALSTYFGYSPERVDRFDKRFHPSPWISSGRLRVIESAPLQLIGATRGRSGPGA
jgi:hypothetical protein